jgi:hypothetical protein
VAQVSAEMAEERRTNSCCQGLSSEMCVYVFAISLCLSIYATCTHMFIFIYTHIGERRDGGGASGPRTRCQRPAAQVCSSRDRCCYQKCQVRGAGRRQRAAGGPGVCPPRPPRLCAGVCVCVCDMTHKHARLASPRLCAGEAKLNNRRKAMHWHGVT